MLVAAGRGERLGSPYPKAFAKLAGRPLLAESLERLDASDWIEGIVVVAPPEWEEPVILLAEEVGAGKVTAAVTGGETRADSVRAGLADVPEEAVAVLVHDAARPLLPAEVVERVLAALGEGWDGAVPALAVGDTLKRARAVGEVAETVDRAGLHAVQTPQAFVAQVLRRALVHNGDATDCAGFVERAGGRVRLVEGDLRLLKVTTEADLALAEALLAAEGAGSVLLHERTRAVLITGSVGVGKTSLAAEVGEVLAERGIDAAVLDLDWLGWLTGALDSGVDSLILRNLAAVWPNFQRAGAKRLVLARSVRDARLVNELRAAFDLQVVRLRASEETVAGRLARRDTGAQLEEHLAEHAEEADVADFELANDGPPIRDLAEELVRRLGWT